MKTSRRLQLWLADQSPAFDRPSLYRRTVRAEPKGVTGWDAVLLAMVSMFLCFVGLAGLLVGLFVLGVIVSTWFG
ncbi:hypothetical protein J2X47_001961 [Sphingomonas sp. BE270]|jgi:hypothetical protein|uniref:hypothetical protein n=1 Tax=Sphingomonas sp. BE270 TaxID=2817726 RepID=UPI002866F679|nr:hypothetical protein [Sphingomonas sp. BE270]MDR7257781.1 hypothetical protein [Sphingomonas sp. BE270]